MDGAELCSVTQEKEKRMIDETLIIVSLEHVRMVTKTQSQVTENI